MLGKMKKEKSADNSRVDKAPPLPLLPPNILMICWISLLKMGEIQLYF